MNQAEPNLRSPFKFLDPYTKKDYDFFFGRDMEIENLYDAVNKNRLVLLYGESGTGKTSVVKCGLANRFEVTDWMPFFIRRGKNINDSLNNIIAQSKALGGMEVNDDNCIDALHKISSRYLRPIYLIFDQFEELPILGDEAEKNQFIATIKKILDSEKTASCNLLFILREEYFASLDTFEKEISGFSDRRIRIEKMRPSKVEEVVTSTCAYFNIKLQEGAEIAKQIVKSLSSKSGISLAYLQVFLDMIWRNDYRQTYPSGWNGKGYPPLEFTRNEVSEFGAIEDVLRRFLNERVPGVQKEMSNQHPNINPNTVSTLLDAFVTEEGTKRPINYIRKNKLVYPAENAPSYLSTLSPEILTEILTSLEKSRILFADEVSYELAHDRLAALIDQHRTFEQRNLNDILRQIRAGHQVFLKTEEPLTRKQLLLYEDYFSQLNLDEDLQAFVKESEKIRTEEEQKAIKLAEERAEKEKKLREKAERNAKRARKFSRIASFLFLIVLVFGVYWLKHFYDHKAAFEPYLANLEQKFWGEVKSKNSVEAYNDYLEIYPEGDYAGVAKTNISDLKKNKRVRDTTHVPPPPPVVSSPTLTHLFNGDQLIVTAGNGTAPYTLVLKKNDTVIKSWEDLVKGDFIIDIASYREDPGDYVVTIEDANGKKTEMGVEIDAPKPTTLNLKIGDPHGGGIVAYLEKGGQHGLIVAPPGFSKTKIEWGCWGTKITGADNETYGSGKLNTNNILGGCSELGIAAYVCHKHDGGGFNDWYLPSKKELTILYNNRDKIGGFEENEDYWSSTEVDEKKAWNMDCFEGQFDELDKVQKSRVRPVRKF